MAKPCQFAKPPWPQYTLPRMRSGLAKRGKEEEMCAAATCLVDFAQIVDRGAVAHSRVVANSRMESIGVPAGRFARSPCQQQHMPPLRTNSPHNCEETATFQHIQLIVPEYDA